MRLPHKILLKYVCMTEICCIMTEQISDVSHTPPFCNERRDMWPNCKNLEASENSEFGLVVTQLIVRAGLSKVCHRICYISQ